MDTSLFSQEIPPDVTVHVGETSFSLHKLMLVAKSNYIRKQVLEWESADLSRIDLSDIPGGPEAFEKAAKFCYGVNFEITVHNVAALHCAAKYLGMTDEYCGNNLVERTDDFMSQVALQSLTGAVMVLKSCEELLPIAEDLLIVHRCVEVASAKACVEANFPSHSPAKWWTDKLSILGTTFFEKIIDAMRSRGAEGRTLASAIIVYTERSLSKLMHNHFGNGMKPLDTQQQELVEDIVALITSEESLFPVNFLCCLLRCTIILRAHQGCKNELEKQISAVFEQVTVDELLILTFTHDEEKVNDLESVKRIISRFVDKEKSVAAFNAGDFGDVSSPAMQRVAKTVDTYLGKIATNGKLSITKFNGIVNLIPKETRRDNDDLYHAIDIYLKAHPQLDELEREKLCSVLDPHNLSPEARAHASQNKRLPVQIILHALYYNQLKLRSGMEDNQSIPDAISMRNHVQADIFLAKENVALRTELLKMKMYIQDMHKLTQEMPPRTNSERRPSFLSSMSKTLGKCNPFNKNDSKDSMSINDGIVDLTRKRGFSIS